MNDGGVELVEILLLIAVVVGALALLGLALMGLGLIGAVLLLVLLVVAGVGWLLGGPFEGVLEIVVPAVILYVVIVVLRARAKNRRC